MKTIVNNLETEQTNTETILHGWKAISGVYIFSVFPTDTRRRYPVFPNARCCYKGVTNSSLIGVHNAMKKGRIDRAISVYILRSKRTRRKFLSCAIYSIFFSKVFWGVAPSIQRPPPLDPNTKNVYGGPAAGPIFCFEAKNRLGKHTWRNPF